MKISICIPTYDKENQNIQLIKKCVESCLLQDYLNFDIIISDHSSDDGVVNLVNEYNTNKINYYRYVEHVGEPAYNTNNAIKKSDSDYIKIMNQDDYFSQKDSLTKMANECKNNRWSLISFVHLDNDTNNLYNPMKPKITDDGTHLLYGINTVGCPSVGLFPNNNFFDTNVSYMIDCELWYNLFKKYGSPGIVEDFGLIIRTGSHNLTSKLQLESDYMIKKDIEYVKQKYKI